MSLRAQSEFQGLWNVLSDENSILDRCRSTALFLPGTIYGQGKLFIVNYLSSESSMGYRYESSMGYRVNIYVIINKFPVVGRRYQQLEQFAVRKSPPLSVSRPSGRLSLFQLSVPNWNLARCLLRNCSILSAEAHVIIYHCHARLCLKTKNHRWWSMVVEWTSSDLKRTVCLFSPLKALWQTRPCFASLLPALGFGEMAVDAINKSTFPLSSNLLLEFCGWFMRPSCTAAWQLSLYYFA